MSRWATISLVGIALALVIFVSIYVPLKSENEGRKPVGGALFDVDSDDIRGIKITRGDESFELKRGDFNWEMGPDPNDRASVEAVKGLIELARNTIVVDRIDASEIDGQDRLSEYGLRKSRLKLDFKGDGDHPLLIGKDAVDEKRVYVRFENSKDVYLVSSELLNFLLRPREEFRDRKLSNLKPARVDRIVLHDASGEIELKRSASGWTIIRPLTTRADDEAVNAFLSKLLRLQIDKFISSKADSGKLGLAEPLAEIQIFGEGDRDPEVLRVGSPASEGGIYAYLSPRNIFCRLPLAARDLATADLMSFRDLSLAHINLDLVDVIRISSSTVHFTIARKDGGWELNGEGRRVPVNADTVQRMVETLAQTKSTHFEPATIVALKKNGLTSPLFTINFLSVVSENTPESSAGEQSVLEVKFAASKTDGTVPVYVTGSSEIAFAPAKVLELLPSDPAAWAAR